MSDEVSAKEPVSRPFGVTLVVALTYLAAFLDITSGIWVMLTRNDAAQVANSGATPAGLLVVGLIQVFVGIFIGLLAAALGRGSRGARLIVTFLMVLRLGIGLYETFSLSGWHRLSGLLMAVIAALVLALLYNRKASVFFDRAY